MARSPFSRLMVLMVVVSLPVLTFAGSVGQPRGGGDSIRWDLSVSGHDSVVLSVSHAGEVYTKTFKNGKQVSFSLRDLPSDVEANGSYTYELRVIPSIPAGLQKKLADSRKSGDEKAASKLLRDAGITIPEPQTGGFSVINGSIADPDAVEGGSNARPGTPTTNAVSSTRTGPGGRFQPGTEDQVIPDDLIVQGSGCFGFDCVNNESFGFDTIRLKENNLRIKAEDTSVGSFPTNDWQLTFNDSASGGSSKFSVEDITGAKVPMTITAGAATNSIFADSTGRVGFRTSTPVLDLHVNTSNTPALRLEQNNSGGFTAQTWDIGANEANFFVRDVTGGSRLSLRIRPGAPTSSVDISADGDVGIGTGSPLSRLDIRQANAHVLAGNGTVDFLGAGQTGYGASNNAEQLFFAVQTGLAFLGSVSNTNLGFITNNSTKMVLTAGGNLGIGTTAPTSQLVIVNGGSSSSINAGSAQFTVASSRTFKDNIEPVEVTDILARIEQVPVVTYDFKDNGPKDRMGLVAEDFHKVFTRGDDKHIDGQEVQMALWLAVQKLTAENKALTDRLENLEKQVVPAPDSNQ